MVSTHSDCQYRQSVMYEKSTYRPPTLEGIVKLLYFNSIR